MLPDTYYDGSAGFVGSSLEELHSDMSRLELPECVPESVKRCHDAIRHATIYSFFSYDLLTLAASQTFPCLELALRHRIWSPVCRKIDPQGQTTAAAALAELLESAHAQGLIAEDVRLLAPLRNMFRAWKRTPSQCGDVSGTF